MKQRSVCSNTACSRLLAVSSGENSRNASVAAYRSRISSPDDTVLPTIERPGASIGTSYVARSSTGSSSRSRPPFAYGVADMRRSPSGARARSSGTSRPDSSNSVSGEYDRSHSSSIRTCSGLSASPDSGTWWARNVPCTWTPSTTSGPVQPFGVRSTIAGHPASTSRVPRRMSSRPWASRNAAYSAGNTSRGSSPDTTTGSQPWLRRYVATSSSEVRPSTVGPAIL